MREIKFRVWDEKEKTMIPWWEILHKSSGPEALEHLCSGKWLPFMQFTGLHDRNSKEIYEGDILAHPEYIVKNGAIVQWEDGSWSIGPGWPVCEFYEGVTGVSECEVIGNIYENLELLDK